jgi:hypothetical protein
MTLPERHVVRLPPEDVPPIVHEVLGSPGQPLDAETRAFMETRFQHDFGTVRVHADSRAARSAGAINALAYTVGPKVVFSSGQFRPRCSEGRRLLAHELTHVLQQEETTQNIHRRLWLTLPSDPDEKAADVTATLIEKGGPVGRIAKAPGLRVQRTIPSGRSNRAQDAVAEEARLRIGDALWLLVAGELDIRQRMLLSAAIREAQERLALYSQATGSQSAATTPLMAQAGTVPLNPILIVATLLAIAGIVGTSNSGQVGRDLQHALQQLSRTIQQVTPARTRPASSSQSLPPTPPSQEPHLLVVAAVANALRAGRPPRRMPREPDEIDEGRRNRPRHDRPPRIPEPVIEPQNTPDDLNEPRSDAGSSDAGRTCAAVHPDLEICSWPWITSNGSQLRRFRSFRSYRACRTAIQSRWGPVTQGNARPGIQNAFSRPKEHYGIRQGDGYLGTIFQSWCCEDTDQGSRLRDDMFTTDLL